MRMPLAVAAFLTLLLAPPAMAQIEVGGSAGAGISLGPPDPMLTPPKPGSGAPALESGLTEAQRVAISRAIEKDRPPRSGLVLVGLAVPDNTPLRKLPAAVVSIIPAYQGYKYFMAGRALSVVEPQTRQVVDVIRLDKDKKNGAKREMR
jgi:hypothetical protein